MENIQNKIVHLMANITKGDKEKKEVQIQEIKQLIFEELDQTSNDEEIVRFGKFLKILEDLEKKIV